MVTKFLSQKVPTWQTKALCIGNKTKPGCDQFCTSSSRPHTLAEWTDLTSSSVNMAVFISLLLKENMRHTLNHIHKTLLLNQRQDSYDIAQGCIFGTNADHADDSRYRPELGVPGNQRLSQISRFQILWYSCILCISFLICLTDYGSKIMEYPSPPHPSTIHFSSPRTYCPWRWL